MGSMSDGIGNQQLAPAASRSMQSKTKALRQTLLATAAKFFAGMGYDSISLATIEAAAKAPKNVIPYHFGSKANLWREAANFIFQPIQAKVDALAAHAHAPVDAKQIVETFVEISAAHPEVAQLIFQEAKAQSWRLEYLVSHQSKPLLPAPGETSRPRGGAPPDPPPPQERPSAHRRRESPITCARTPPPLVQKCPLGIATLPLVGAGGDSQWCA